MIYTESGAVALEEITGPLTISEREKKAIVLLIETLKPVVTKENLSETIDHCMKELDNDSACVHLTIPQSVSEDEEEEMALWVSEAAGRNLLVDVRVDPEAIGGCMIGIKGKYYDYSYRYWFEKKREEIEKMIGGILK